LRIIDQLKKYHFELKHLLVLFIVLIIFQLIVSYIHKISLQNLLEKTEDWYKQHSVEKIAHLTTTSIELLLEASRPGDHISAEYEKRMVQSFNIIFSQQLLQQNVDEISILVRDSKREYALDNGQDLFNFIYRNQSPGPGSADDHIAPRQLYNELRDILRSSEQIYSIREGEHSFIVFVPLVPNGEYAGAVYMQLTPDLSFISRQMGHSYDETSLIFSALILFGLMAMFYISSYTVKERDETQEILFQEREKYLRDYINHQKESLFTKRIYHTHHKAEKVMGFIKEDIRKISIRNIDEVKYRVTKYANFVSRVIYDMKWYDPPLQTIRNPMFKTNLNEVLSFLVNHIFLRTSDQLDRITFDLDLDPGLPDVHVNEFVVWEIIEPLIQNSIEHSGGHDVNIILKTEYIRENGINRICIKDNGKGIPSEFLEKDTSGLPCIFLESISTKDEGKNAGYGCFIAYEMSKKCGWRIDARNAEEGGSLFTIEIPLGKS
jgi:hypothetical protein